MFDSVDSSSQTSLDLDNQERILLKCFDLIELIIEICSLRVHVHARRIINFLIRLVYLASYSVESNADLKKVASLNFIERVADLLKRLFRNDMAKNRCYEEFEQLQNAKNLNPTFLKIIENI